MSRPRGYPSGASESARAPMPPLVRAPGTESVSAPESASGRLAEVMSRGEAALLSGDPERRTAWLRDVEAAERELHTARIGPSWAALLADDEVTASVLAYRDAPLTSACACGGSIHKDCAGGAS